MLVVFGALFLFAVLIFAGFIPIGQSTSQQYSGNVTLWGTLSASDMSPLVDDFNLKKNFVLRYVQKDAGSFKSDLVDALASGTGPDLILSPGSDVWSLRDKVLIIPYASYPERSFRANYIGESDLLLSKDGILGLPFTVDPLVLYYNRDLLTNAGIAKPPVTWDELVSDVSKLVVRDANQSVIKQSAIALGSFGNVDHAKDIMSLLILQSGNQITARNASGDLVSVLKNEISASSSLVPAVSAIRFYASFANPVVSTYTWNAGLPRAQTAFLSNNLAFYIGYASELASIRAQNPNLNFDVALMPQTSGAVAKMTFGNMSALMVAKASKNQATALYVATELASSAFLEKLSAAILLPPVTRDLLSKRTADPYLSLFNQSALMAHGWLDPNGSATDSIWKNMLGSVLSGTLDPEAAVLRASGELDGIIRN